MHKLFFFLLVVSSLSACKNFFDKEVDYNLDSPTPLMVVAMTVQVGDPTLRCFVSKTRGINDTAPYNYELLDTSSYFNGTDTVYNIYSLARYDTLLNAAVTVARNGVNVGTFSPENGFHTLYAEPEIVAGDVWTLNASAQGFTSVTATATVPSKPEIIEIVKGEEGLKDEFGQLYTEYTATLKDSPGKNFYIFEHFIVDSITRVKIGSLVLDVEDNPIFEYTDIGYVLPDYSFENAEFELKLRVPENSISYAVDLKVNSMDEQTFRYLINKATSENNDSNPFAEPVALRSNVQNGEGYFYLFNSTISKVK